MKLYHATPASDADSIRQTGIHPTDCGTRQNGGAESLQKQGLTGVYGFTEIEHAEWFAADNGNDHVIFAFDSGEFQTIVDPEYDGESIFVVCDEPIPATEIAD